MELNSTEKSPDLPRTHTEDLWDHSLCGLGNSADLGLQRPLCYSPGSAEKPWQRVPSSAAPGLYKLRLEMAAVNACKFQRSKKRVILEFILEYWKFIITTISAYFGIYIGMVWNSGLQWLMIMTPKRHHCYCSYLWSRLVTTACQANNSEGRP